MITTRELGNGPGVCVEGVNLETDDLGQQASTLRSLWQTHGLLLLQGCADSPETQIRFSRVFGALEAHPLKTIRSGEYPELMELNSNDQRTNPVSHWSGEPWIGRLGWHKDLIYSGSPNLGAVLRAVTLPDADGETGFADQAAAYDALPAALRQRLEGHSVVYRFHVDLEQMPFLDTRDYEAGPGAPKTPADVGFPDFPDSVYPLVLEHPHTGRRILNICPMFLSHIPGLDAVESDELLHELVAHVTRPEFAYLHQWQTGDMVLWDNWRFMHSARGIRPGQARTIHRTTIIDPEGSRALAGAR